MKRKKYVTVKEVATLFCIEVELIKELADFGLISVYREKRTEYVMEKEIKQIKKAVSLYRDLGINKEGIKMVLSLKEQTARLKKELDMFRRKVEKMEQEYRLKHIEIPAQEGLMLDLDIE